MMNSEKSKSILYRYIISLIFLNLYYNYGYSTPSIKDILINFRSNSHILEEGYMSNQEALKRLDNLINYQITAKIDSIIIIGSSSPEGNYKHNINLSSRRALTIQQYIILKYPFIEPTIIQTSIKAESWLSLVDVIKNDNEIPHQQKVLSIIQQDINQSTKEGMLKQVASGEAWKYIKNKHLKNLRTGAICILYYKKDNVKLHKVKSDINPKINQDILYLENNKLIYDNHIVSNFKNRENLFAIKTNLLADAMTSLNIEIEVPIGKHWSVGAEWMFPWWIFDNNKYYNQLLLGTIEGRYWFHTKRQTEVLSGHALGLYASAGYYDFQWKKKGYQGEILPSVGLSYTYAHKMGEHFRMEYSVGFGILNTKYRKYTANDQYDQFPWLSSGRTIWLGPTKAEVSFVWLISKRVRNEK